MGDAHAYRVIMASRLRSQLAYPTSFAFDVVNQLVYGLIEFIELYAVFHNVDSLAGLGWSQALLVMALSRLAFQTGDLFVGHLDQMPAYLRQGTLETFLIRPLPVLAQVITSDISLRRVSRIVLFGGFTALALARLEMTWTPAAVVLLLAALLGGSLITAAMFITAGTAQFWLIEGGEAANAFTYGGAYVAQFPAGVLPVGVRVFYTAVLPVTFIGYLPTVTLLGLADPLVPSWFGWLTLPVGLTFLTLSLAAWQFGVRHYQGGGG